MMVFLAVLTSAFIYEWKKGAPRMGLMSSDHGRTGKKGILDHGHRQAGRRRRRCVFGNVTQELSDKGFIITTADCLDKLVAPTG